MAGHLKSLAPENLRPHVLLLPQPKKVRFDIKKQPLLFFFCILINTEEGGAVTIYLRDNLGTGLSGVVESLPTFNT